VAHKKLIQSAQYNLYPIWTTTNKGTTEKPAGKDEKIRQGTWEMGRGQKKRTNDAQSHTAISPKRQAKFFVIFMTPKDASIPKGRSPNKGPQYTPNKRAAKANLFKDVSAIK